MKKNNKEISPQDENLSSIRYLFEPKLLLDIDVTMHELIIIYANKLKNIYQLESHSSCNFNNMELLWYKFTTMWMSKLCAWIHCSSETFFNTMSIIIRYLYKIYIAKNKRINSNILQSIAISSLSIASKLNEENYNVKDLCYFTQNKVSIEHIIYLEKIILITLNYEINNISCYTLYKELLILLFIQEKIEYSISNIIRGYILLHLAVYNPQYLFFDQFQLIKSIINISYNNSSLGLYIDESCVKFLLEHEKKYEKDEKIMKYLENECLTSETHIPILIKK